MKAGLSDGDSICYKFTYYMSLPMQCHNTSQFDT